MLIVGISDIKIAKPPDTLITYALGSCVGICLLDPVVSVAGMSHIMLPGSNMVPDDHNSMKFADTAIPYLVRQMERLGAQRSRMKAKIAGGAQMFEVRGGAADSLMAQIGRNNVEAVLHTLGGLGIPVLAKDVLGTYGRTVSFDPATGQMVVKALSKEVTHL